MLRMLLRADVAEKLGRLYKSGVAPTAKQREEFAAARAARPKLAAMLPDARPMASNDPENYAVVGSVAQICVEGVLSEEPDFWAWLFGMDGTTYEDIRDAFALAAADPLVKSVVLDVNSPGGYCDGLFETLAAIESFGKPIAVQATLAASAAYALSAMAGPITAKSPASEFGSVGVLQTYTFDADTEIINVTSTAAPNKRPDPRTPEGKAVIVAELDAVHELFVDGIARGRSNATGKTYTIDQVNTDFGRGAMMLADAAKSAGLIDKMPRSVKRGGSSALVAIDGSSILIEELQPGEKPVAFQLMSTELKPQSAPSAGAQKPQSPPRSAGQETRKVTQMTEDELLAQFPAVHAAVLAKGAAQGHAAGVTHGQSTERKRMSSHFRTAKLHGAKLDGAVGVAVKHIETGASIQEDDVHVEYQEAGAAHRETANRQADSDLAGEALKGAKAPAAQTTDNSDLVAAAMGLTAAPAKKSA